MRFNIQTKITFIIVLIVAGVVTGIYFYLQFSLKRELVQRINHDLHKEARLVQLYFERVDISKLALVEIDHLADTIGQELSARLTIIGLGGKVLGESQIPTSGIAEMENHLYRPEVQQALKDGRGESMRYSSTLRKDFLYVAYPLGKEKKMGIIRLAVPLSDLRTMPQDMKHAFGISFILALGLATLFGILASVWMARPIQDITSMATAITRGDFSHRLRITTNDEIEDLSRAVNEMSDHIKARIEDAVQSKSRLEAVFLSMFEGVMIVDAHGTILLMNQTLKGLLNVTQESAGYKLLEVIRNIEIHELVNKILKVKSGVASCELSILLPEEKIVLVHAAPVIREGTVDGAVLVFHDITQLRRLEKIRQDFVANVSHELRTPVSTIKGYAETLLEGALEDKKNARDFVQIIYDDSDRLAKLVNDLLDLSQIESGKMKFQFNLCSLDSIIDRVVSILNKQAKEKSVQIIKNIPADLPQIRVDETSIAQVLMNLIENAVKYNRPKGSVTVSAKNAGAFVRVSVADTGIGIPDTDLPRIFERFYRVDKARSRQLGGTGLGLSIVKHLIQSHNGEVSVESELDKGSVFSFTLPKA